MEPGTIVDGEFAIRRRLGKGGFGEVYEAEQLSLSRLVALKFVSRPSEEAWLNFKAEAQALALIDHPNIARLYDARQNSSGEPYLVMELVRGTRCDLYCDRADLPVSHRIRLLIDACDAVAACHEKGLIHGDLHPANILIAEANERQVVKVIDLGLAEALGMPLVHGPRPLARAGGVPVFMSPETMDVAVQRDARSDVFSLGAVLYKLLSGLEPRERPEQLESLERVINTPVTPAGRKYAEYRRVFTAPARDIAARRRTTPLELNNLLSGEAGAILSCCLAMNPADRYHNARELREDLAAFLSGKPLRCKKDTDFYELYVLGKWFRRRTKLAVSAVMVAIGTLLWVTLREMKIGQGIVLLFTGVLWDDILKLINRLLKVIF